MSEYTTIQPTQQIPYGYCRCGCGQRTSISKRNRPEVPIKKGEPFKYCPGHYHRGKTKPKVPAIDRFWDKIKVAGKDECWEWIGARAGKGYGVFGISHGTMVYAHRFMWEITYGPIPDGLFVCHHCDNPICSNPLHLFIGTNSDNINDCIQKGRFGDRRKEGVHGVHHGMAKLTDRQIFDIRKRRAVGEQLSSIATRYGISKSHVCGICKRKYWTHI